MSGIKLKRLGKLMEPEPGNPQEIEGVLLPSCSAKVLRFSKSREPVVERH